MRVDLDKSYDDGDQQLAEGYSPFPTIPKYRRIFEAARTVATEFSWNDIRAMMVKSGKPAHEVERLSYIWLELEKAVCSIEAKL